MGIQFGSILQCYWIPNSTTRSDLIAVSILNKKMTLSNFICYLIALVHIYIVHLNMVHILFCCIYFFFSLNWLILLKCPTIAIWHAWFSSHDMFIDSSNGADTVNLKSLWFKTVTNQSIMIGFCIILLEVGFDFCMILWLIWICFTGWDTEDIRCLPSKWHSFCRVDCK